MNRLSSLSEYELFIYTIQQNYPAILRSTVVLIRRGNYYADVRGELMFADDYRLVVFERLRCLDEEPTITAYGYEIWHANEKLCWYDSQAHPHDATLASTHPHHKHVPPNIKHHRIPAPGLSFTPPNLPLLIEEVRNLPPKKWTA